MAVVSIGGAFVVSTVLPVVSNVVESEYPEDCVIVSLALSFCSEEHAVITPADNRTSAEKINFFIFFGFKQADSLTIKQCQSI